MQNSPTVADLNDLANTVMVARLEIESLEQDKEKLLSEYEAYQAILTEIEVAKLSKEKAQGELLAAMHQAELKSWKTEKCNFARASRITAQVDPAYKKAVERELKEGKEVIGWNLNKTEYLSIKLT